MEISRIIKKLFIKLVICCFIFTACKPTPALPVIINKADGKLQGAVTQKAEIQKYKTPENYKNELDEKDGKTKIYIDAKVIIPDVPKFPVLKIKPVPFTLEFTKKVSDILMEGAPVYEPRNTMTKSEIEAEIIKLQVMLADKKGMLDYYSGDQKTVDEVTLMFQGRIKILREMHEKAPETYTKIPGKFEFKPSSYYENQVFLIEDQKLARTDKETKAYLEELDGNNELVLDAELKNGQYARLQVLNAEHNGVFSYNLNMTKSFVLNSRTYQPEPYSKENYSLYPALTITQEQTINTAQEALNDFGVKNMRLEYCSLTKEGITGDEVKKMQQEAGNDNQKFSSLMKKTEALKKPLYYQLEFRPEYGGIRTIYGEPTRMVKGVYKPEIGDETIRMTVDDTGVTGFRWEMPMQQTVSVNDNVKLLPFDEIMKIVENQLAMQYNLIKLSGESPENDDYKEMVAKLEAAALKINKIELGMQRVAVADNFSEYMMVPAWRFTGFAAVKRKDYDLNIEEIFRQMESQKDIESGFSYLTVNALDGSIIERELGTN